MTEDEAEMLLQAAILLDRIQAAGSIPKAARAAADKASNALADLLDMTAGHMPHDVLWVASEGEGSRTSH